MGILSGALSVGASLIGGALNNKSAADAAQRNYDAQKEFAQNGIRWKVADAKAAGIHPLAALGVNNASFSPSFTAGDNGIAQAGQEFGRAIEAKSTRAERALEVAMQRETHSEQLRGLRLENDIRAEQLLQMKENSLEAVRKASRPPAMPAVGIDTNVVKGQGDARMPSKKGSVPAGDSMYQFQETFQPGVFTLQPGNDWAQLFEDKGALAELWPLGKTYGVDLAHRILGRAINGMVYSDSHGGWVKAGGPLDDTKTSWRSSRYWLDALRNPKSKIRRFNQFFEDVSLPRVLGRTIFRRRY